MGKILLKSILSTSQKYWTLEVFQGHY